MKPLFAAAVALVGIIALLWPASAETTDLYPRGQLFLIEKEGAQPSYLFGTLYVGDLSHRDIPDAALEALNESEVAVFVSRPFGMAQPIGPGWYLPEGDSLEDHIGEDLVRKVAAILSECGVAESRLRRMQPWAVSCQILCQAVSSHPLAEGAYVMDPWLEYRAESLQMRIVKLESPEEAMTLYTTLTKAEERALVEAAIDWSAAVDLLALSDAYRNGDLAALGEGQFDTEAHLGNALYAKLRHGIAVRYDRWMIRLEPVLKLRRTFITVSVLNLPGPGGLIDRLTRAGYRVTAVP